MSGVNQIWKSLARKVSISVNITKAQNSMVYVPNGFFVNIENQEEFYYWDTYWIIRGIDFMLSIYIVFTSRKCCRYVSCNISNKTFSKLL